MNKNATLAAMLSLTSCAAPPPTPPEDFEGPDTRQTVDAAGHPSFGVVARNPLCVMRETCYSMDARLHGQTQH